MQLKCTNSPYLIGSGKDEVSGILSKRASMPVFAAVSPNRVSGPWKDENANSKQEGVRIFCKSTETTYLNKSKRQALV